MELLGVTSEEESESEMFVLVGQLTSELVDAPDFRVTIEPKPENGLRLRSQVMADKPVTVRRERIGQKTGCLRDQDMARLGIALPFVSGFAMLWVLSTNRKILVRLTAV